MEIKRGSTIELSNRDLRDLERVANILNAISGEFLGFEKITDITHKIEFSKDDINKAVDILSDFSEHKTWTCGEESEEI